ncbi:carboxymuconolactone decarboxylase family protein [Nostoc flagelliforme FACHB-838]|uniref:Carboxymuconolactone decarboxylase family protein n=1 Tax=Nostoc flagelliforme FACHB-838 TaxID=2692904 RepID=A0ABR8DKK6_9NOSO|nr:carboxymuconolactone decarboxylase family protein [Nostoc flagelliforme]MBD2529956.1 carboxymuconolactone decarboxylase family protein [Nostoc flagelliforme FACHB-838]
MRRALLTSAIATLTTVVLGIITNKAHAQSSDRYTRGIKTLKRIGGTDYACALRPLQAFFPDLAQISVEYPFGDIMSRPGLDLKQREIVNVAALTALGSVRPTLKFHIHGMLNVGCTPQEVVETILHAVVYAGFPAAQDGITIAREVFKERKLEFKPVSSRPQGDRYQLGIQNLQQTEGDRVKTIATQFANLAPDLPRLIIEFARGEIWNRRGLSLKSREFATLVMVTALGNQSDSVETHVEGALRAGATETEIKELLLQMTVYAGYPKTLTAVTAAQQIFVNLKQRGIVAISPQPNLESRRQAETNEARYRRGLEALNQISKASGEAVVKSFEDIAPDLGRYILEFSYGEVFSRPNLDLKIRELATVSALTGLNTTASELPLKVHINGALNVGANCQEIVEAIIQMIPYVGFVKVQQAMALAEAVFQERNV